MPHISNKFLDMIPRFQPSQFLETLLSNVSSVLRPTIPFLSSPATVLGSGLGFIYPH